MRDITLEDTFYHDFTTRSFATGIPTTLSGTPALSVLEGNNATPITAGVSVSVDRAAVTGLNEATIVATTANGYEVGKSYSIYISTGTVGGVSVVGEVVGHFTVQASAAAVDLANGTDGLGAIKAETALIVADTNELQTDWADGGRLDLIQDIIAADTTTDIPALIATAQADLDIITDTDGVILGAAGVDLIWDEVITGAAHNVASSAGRRLRGIQEFQGYEDGAIWIDTVNGAAGTTLYENGTVENAVSTIADANTLNTSLTLNRFHIFSASAITFAATQANQVFVGSEWTLALGGQNIAGTDIKGATVSGIATGANPHFEHCSVGNTTVAPARFGWCGLSGTLTVGSAGNYFLHDCYSEVAGASAPTIDMGVAVGATNVSIRRWAGGLTINNLASGDVVSIDGIFGTITLNGADAQVELRGIAKAVVNNLTGSPTVNDDTLKTDILEDWSNGGRLDLILDAIVADTNELQTDDVPGLIAALNDVAATDIVSAGPITTLAGAVVNVDLCDTVTTNTDMRGTDNAALASVCTEGRLAELDAANLPADIDAILVDTASIGIVKNAAFSNFEFPMVLTSDHYTAATGLTVTGQRSIDGGAFTGVSGTIAEVGSGIYQIDLLAADTNGDVITYKFSAGTADDTLITIQTRA